jgi:predicted ATPase with chaperone activity
MKNADAQIEPDLSELFLDRLDEIEEVIANKVVEKLSSNSRSQSGKEMLSSLQVDELTNIKRRGAERKMFDPIAGP